jgi:hypothetical protein
VCSLNLTENFVDAINNPPIIGSPISQPVLEPQNTPQTAQPH